MGMLKARTFRTPRDPFQSDRQFGGTTEEKSTLISVLSSSNWFAIEGKVTSNMEQNKTSLGRYSGGSAKKE